MTLFNIRGIPEVYYDELFHDPPIEYSFRVSNWAEPTIKTLGGGMGKYVILECTALKNCESIYLERGQECLLHLGIVGFERAMNKFLRYNKITSNFKEHDRTGVFLDIGIIRETTKTIRITSMRLFELLGADDEKIIFEAGLNGKEK